LFSKDGCPVNCAIIGFMGIAVLAGIVNSIALKRIEISNKT
jgi:hypothetical protein